MLLYASFVSLILQAVRFTVTMLLKWCVLPTLISGKNAKPSSFFRCTYFDDSVILFTKRCSSPSEHFAFNVLFLWDILFVHLKVLRGGELRLVRTVGMVRLDEILFEILGKTWHQHWDHHHKFTAAHRLHKPMLLSNLYNLDLKPPSFAWCKGIHALQ